MDTSHRCSDKWIEQGNYAAVTGTSQTITFKKPFTKTDYTVTVSNYYQAVPSGTHLINIGNKTTKSFIRYGSAAWTGFFWYACGY